MIRLASKKGQSTLEYVIIWTAIVAAILVSVNAFLRPAIEGPGGMANQAADKITEEVGDLVGGIGN
ncbi:hypothetical protein ACFL2I_03295 [Candidatus Omnitrophota bacterium]